MKREDIEKLRAAELEAQEQTLVNEMRRKLELGNIPPSLYKVSLDSIPDGAFYKQKIIDWMGRVANARKQGVPEYGLYLHGIYSSGKTSIAAGLGMWAIKNGMSAYYVKYTALGYTKKDNPPWHTEGQNTWPLWDYLQRVPLLIVDDLLSNTNEKFGRQNSDAFSELLEYRMEDSTKLNIITGNHRIDEYGHIGMERLGWLITQSCYIQEVAGVDYRKFIADNRKAL